MDPNSLAELLFLTLVPAITSIIRVRGGEALAVELYDELGREPLRKRQLRGL